MLSLSEFDRVSVWSNLVEVSVDLGDASFDRFRDVGARFGRRLELLHQVPLCHGTCRLECDLRRSARSTSFPMSSVTTADRATSRMS
jgi:hypothetical protein